MTDSTCRITFAGMDAAEAVKLEVRAWLPRLGVLIESATGAHVLVEAMDEHRKERRYHVRMEWVMPEGMVVVAHDHPSNVPHEDVYVAIRNAFRAARRQLEEYVKTRRPVAAVDRDAGAFEPRLESDLATAPQAVSVGVGAG